MSDQINNIRQLLIDGKEYKALKALVDLLKEEKEGKELLNSVFLLQSRLDGIESKFNQGITTYENWDVNRNKIIKSTLDFINKVESTLSLHDAPAEVDKIEKAPALATNTTFIHRLANPTLIRRLSFYYLFLWVFLGAMDTLFFQAKSVEVYNLFGIPFSTYINDGSIVTWLKDFIGHLFAFGTVLLAIILEIVKSNLSNTSFLVMNKVNDLYRKYFFVYLVAAILIIGGVIYANALYTSEQSSVALWSVEISPGFLPQFIAANYFLIVEFPLSLGIFHYCLLLFVTIREFKSFSTYSPFHGDKSFGLLTVGRSIFWGTMAFVIIMILALILQLNLKNGELTPGIFIGALSFFILVWFGAINPLKKLSAKLGKEKMRLYESVKEEVRSNNRMLGNQSSTEDLNTVKLLLDASRDNEKELLQLRVLPITNNELIIGGVILLTLLASIIFQIS